MYSVTFEFLDDIRIHGLGMGYIQIAFGDRAEPLSGKAAPVERGGQSGIDPQGGVVIGNGVLVPPALEVGKPPAVQGIDKIRPEPQRRVAILPRRLQLTEHGADPAAVVE